MYFNHIFVPIANSADSLPISTHTSPTKPSHVSSNSLSQHHFNQSQRPNSHAYPTTFFSQENPILPHWGPYLNATPDLTSLLYSFNNKTYHLEPLSQLYLNNSNSSLLSTQIATTILSGSSIPAEPYSSAIQDQVRIGQSNLIPQVAVAPQSIQIQAIKSSFIHINDSLSAQIEDKEQFSHPLSSKSTTSTTSTASIPYANPTATPSVNQFLSLFPSMHYHTTQNTVSSSPNQFSSQDGFFFSDDSIVHSLLPHFSPSHQSIVSASSTSVPTTDPAGNITSIPQSPHHIISTLPNTQQHLPDHFNSYLESGLSKQHNREGEYPWVTPATMISWDAYKRLSLLTSSNLDERLQRQLGCLHRRHVPHFITFLFSSCLSKHLTVPSIQTSYQYFKLQSAFAQVLSKYHSVLGDPNLGKSIKNPHEIQSHSNTNSKTSSHSTYNAISILQFILKSIRESFDTSISVRKDNASIYTIPTPKSIDSYIPHQAHLQHIENQRLEMDLAPLQVFNTCRAEQLINQYPVPSLEVDVNHPTSMYTHDLAPNPTSAKVSKQALSWLISYSPEFQTKMAETQKFDAVESNATATNVISQPFLPLFNKNQFATKNNLLFNYDNETVSIYPFPTSTIGSLFSNPFKYFHNKQLPRISCADFFSSAFPTLIRTPINLINQLNSVTADHVKRSSASFIMLTEHHKNRIENSLGVESIPRDLLDDIYLQIATTQTVPSSQKSPIFHSVQLLTHYFDSIAQTPLFYLISPVAMSYFIRFLVTSSDSIDSYSLFQALIRWAIYHTSMRYQNHQQICPFLKQRKSEYLAVIEYSLDQYKIVQQDYLANLHHSRAQPSTSIQAKDAKEALLSLSDQLHSQFSNPPLPPPFVLQVPPQLQLKYKSHLDFINTPNPCEFCYRYEGIQIVFKPWTQPCLNLLSPLHIHETPNATHALPSSLYDMNFFNLRTYHGFNFSSPTSSAHNIPSLAIRYDLSSGKLNDHFGGHFISFSPQTLYEISQAPPSVHQALSNFHSSSFNPPTTHPNDVSFTSMFSSTTPNDITIPISPQQPQKQTNNSSITQLTSSFNSLSAFSQPYGFHIPSNIIRHELAPMLQFFPSATFTSSQLAQLFQEPSIFTPYEQFYILSTRIIPSRYFPQVYSPNRPNQKLEHPYYPTLDNTPSIGHTHLNPHSTIYPFQIIENSYDVDRLNNEHGRYICPLFDDQTTYRHYSNALLLEMGKGFFAQSVNPQFNSQQTTAYINLISTMLFENYNKKSLNQNQSAPPPNPLSSCNQKSDQNSDQNMNQTLTHNIQNPYLKAFYSKYHHDLRSTLQSLPGYRDGLFSIDFFSYTQEFLSNVPRLSDDQNQQFHARFSDNLSYTVAFPRPLHLHSDNYLSSNIHPMNSWISAEYLLNIQQFTKNVLVDQSTLYPFIHKAPLKMSFDQSCDPAHAIASTTSFPNTMGDTNTYSQFQSQYSPQYDEIMDPQSIPNLTMNRIAKHPDPKPNNLHYYYEDTPYNLPIAVPTIHGTTFSHNRLTTNLELKNHTSSNFLPPELDIRYFCPNLIIYYNWIAAPAIGFLCGFACLVIFGLIYQGQMNATPKSLIPLLILAILTFMFPFLFTLQLHFETAARNGKICGMKKCCGSPAYICFPTADLRTSFVEHWFFYLTFSKDRINKTPSVSRLFSSGAMTWLFLSIYLNWSGLVHLSLLAHFVPLYVLFGLYMVTFFHKVGTVGLINLVPTILFTISLGVLHAALASPENDKYNAIAVTAPFLLPFAGCVIVILIWFVVDVLCDDDPDVCDSGFCWAFIGCFALFLVMSFWYAFLCLLLQDLIRPGTWWTPPYFAVHSVTYVFIIILLFFLFYRDEDRDISPLSPDAYQRSSHLHDDVTVDFQTPSRLVFVSDDSGELPTQLIKYLQSSDTMSRL